MIIIIIMMMKCTCRTSCGARPAVAERRRRWMTMKYWTSLMTINLGIKYTVQAEPQWLAWFYPAAAAAAAAAAASSSSTSSSPEAENQSHPIHFAVLSLGTCIVSLSRRRERIGWHGWCGVK
jgi:hypothetical protein